MLAPAYTLIATALTTSFLAGRPGALNWPYISQT